MDGHPETDVMDQFLDPETDIMGERNYIETPIAPAKCFIGHHFLDQIKFYWANNF